MCLMFGMRLCWPHEGMLVICNACVCMQRSLLPEDGLLGKPGGGLLWRCRLQYCCISLSKASGPIWPRSLCSLSNAMVLLCMAVCIAVMLAVNCCWAAIWCDDIIVASCCSPCWLFSCMPWNMPCIMLTASAMPPELEELLGAPKLPRFTHCPSSLQAFSCRLL